MRSHLRTQWTQWLKWRVCGETFIRLIYGYSCRENTVVGILPGIVLFMHSEAFDIQCYNDHVNFLAPKSWYVIGGRGEAVP